MLRVSEDQYVNEADVVAVTLGKAMVNGEWLYQLNVYLRSPNLKSVAVQHSDSEFIRKKFDRILRDLRPKI